MKQLIIILAVFTLSGCSMETQQIDRDWGKAQTAAWNSMIANPHPQPATSPPSGLDGINAEGAMDVYNSGFWKQQQQPSNVFTFGVTSEKQK